MSRRHQVSITIIIIIIITITIIITIIFRCVMCKCLPSKCDCNPLAEDPDSFCSGGDVCKVGIYSR